MNEPEVKLGLVSNLWSKQMHFLKSGDVEQGHSHRFDHTTLLARGSLKITCNNKSTDFIAPNMIYIKAGVEHRLEALEDDTVCYCIHAIRDGDRIEDIVDPSMIPEGVTAFNHVIHYGSLLQEDFLDRRAK